MADKIKTICQQKISAQPHFVFIFNDILKINNYFEPSFNM